MTDKETATATLTEFFARIGSEQPQIDDSWDGYKHVSADKRDVAKRYYVSAVVYGETLDVVDVVVYDLKKNAKRKVVLRVEALPAMAAKFVLEAIDAYEAEMDAA